MSKPISLSKALADHGIATPVLIEADLATEGGYRPLTTSYIPAEYWMLANVVADMQRGDIAYVLVLEEARERNRICVYRTRKGFKS